MVLLKNQSGQYLSHQSTARAPVWTDDPTDAMQVYPNDVPAFQRVYGVEFKTEVIGGKGSRGPGAGGRAPAGQPSNEG
jgi:hypothetical protein